jgi:hypothetical protein
MLEMLMFMREQFLRGVEIEAFIGRPDINALSAFIEGALFVRYCHRAQGDYGEFFDWLRDVKKECPQYATGGAWARKCLEECGGDHRAAIHRFLGFVAEFVALREQGGNPRAGTEQP